MHLGEDGERHLFGRICADIQPDWRVQPVALFAGNHAAVPFEIRENLLRSFPRPQQPNVGERAAEEALQQRHVVDLMVRHHHRQRLRIGCRLVG